MTELPDEDLDHRTLGYYAPAKGLSRDACPYAESTEAHDQWLAGYDAAVGEGVGEKAPPTKGQKA